MIRVIYYVSCSLIVLWLFRPTVFWLIGLEFSNPEFLFSYRWTWIYILPAAVCLTIVKKVLGKEPQNSWATSVISRLGMATIACFSVCLSLFTGMCGWREVGILYTDNLGGVRIVRMEYSCGAYDSDPRPKEDIRTISPVGKYFQWNHSCDTTELDLI